MGYIITILKIEAKITAITSTFTSIFRNSSKTQAKIAAIAVINASISQPRENNNTKIKRLPSDSRLTTKSMLSCSVPELAFGYGLKMLAVR